MKKKKKARQAAKRATPAPDEPGEHFVDPQGAAVGEEGVTEGHLDEDADSEEGEHFDAKSWLEAAKNGDLELMQVGIDTRIHASGCIELGCYAARAASTLH